jgi:transcriptional regulator with XRE-family HTH domain
MGFPERLKALRLEKRLMQEELAKIIKTTNATISKYENGRIEPNLETLQLLAEHFDVSVDYILDKTNVRHQHDVLAFHTTEDLTEEEIEEVKKYIEFLKTKRDD